MRANVGRWRRKRCNNDKCRVVLKNVDERGIMDLTGVVVCAEIGGGVSRQLLEILEKVRKIKGCGERNGSF